MKDEQTIAEEMSVETRIVHQNILDDQYAWEDVQRYTINLWNRRTTLSGHRLDDHALLYDIGKHIESLTRQNCPAFTGQIWLDCIDYVLAYVDWFKIAQWHVANAYAQALIDEDEENAHDMLGDAS